MRAPSIVTQRVPPPAPCAAVERRRRCSDPFRSVLNEGTVGVSFRPFLEGRMPNKPPHQNGRFSVTFRQLAKQLFRVRGQTSRHTIPAASRHLLRSNILICGRARTSD